MDTNIVTDQPASKLTMEQRIEKVRGLVALLRATERGKLEIFVEIGLELISFRRDFPEVMDEVATTRFGLGAGSVYDMTRLAKMFGSVADIPREVAGVKEAKGMLPKRDKDGIAVRHAEAVRLDGENMEVKDIAEAVGMKPGAVSLMLNRRRAEREIVEMGRKGVTVAKIAVARNAGSGRNVTEGHVASILLDNLTGAAEEDKKEWRRVVKEAKAVKGRKMGSTRRELTREYLNIAESDPLPRNTPVEDRIAYIVPLVQKLRTKDRYLVVLYAVIGRELAAIRLDPECKREEWEGILERVGLESIKAKMMMRIARAWPRKLPKDIRTVREAARMATEKLKRPAARQG